MYGGLLLFSSGLSINSGVDSGEKMVLTALLGFVLVSSGVSIDYALFELLTFCFYDRITKLQLRKIFSDKFMERYYTYIVTINF